ncbi:MAG: acyl-[acyl-carrier-protein] thioesterase [Candidatus Cryptobacteroides sp.]
MEQKYKKALQIPSYLVDSNKRLRPSCFMSLAQEMAMRGADMMNFGHNDLAKFGLAWVVSRTHLEFTDTPKWKDELEFSTWHKKVDGLFFLRDYLLTDTQGNVKVKGTSSWLVIDTRTRRLYRTDRLAENFDLTPQCTEDAVEQPAAKIIIPKDLESELSGRHTVKYSDLDFIGHANNTAYVSWAMDTLPLTTVLEKPLKVLDINFNLETKAGEEIELYRTAQITPEEEIYYIEGKVEDRSHFTARLAF